MTTLERLFPNARARHEADKAIDAIPPSESMSTFLDEWEQRYFDVAGSSPMRRVGRMIA